MKMTIKVEDFAPRHNNNNSLRGFASIRIVELHLIVNDVGVHSRDGRRWVSMPARPWLKGDAVVLVDGRIKYSPVIEFANTKVRAAFSDAVIKALLEYDPRALECRGAAQ